MTVTMLAATATVAKIDAAAAISSASSFSSTSSSQQQQHLLRRTRIRGLRSSNSLQGSMSDGISPLQKAAGSDSSRGMRGVVRAQAGKQPQQQQRRAERVVRANAAVNLENVESAGDSVAVTNETTAQVFELPTSLERFSNYQLPPKVGALSSHVSLSQPLVVSR
ncbi:unnamed protein product [Calypogeia fissa]